MKTILVISLLLIDQLSFAQNYHPILANQESHFGCYGAIRSIRIDSMKNAGTDIIYYNHHILDRLSQNSPIVGDYYPSDSSWIGQEIIQKPNGDFIFVNVSHDSIKVKSNVKLNDSWTFYTYPDNNYVEATVSQHDTMTFFRNYG